MLAADRAISELVFASAVQVQSNGDWSLFCPNEAPGLADVYGDEFNELYHRYTPTYLPTYFLPVCLAQ